ncbi:hypothetical protein ACVCAH_25910 [Micromonospora sp. LZ34]
MTDRLNDSDRGATELLLGALAGSTLLPFIQAVATKAGEDVYQLVRDKLSRKGRRNAKAEIRAAGTVTLTAPGPRIVLQVPERITPTMAARLENVRLPVDRAGWLLVAWDEPRGRWFVKDIPEPPPTASSLDS